MKIKKITIVGLCVLIVAVGVGELVSRFVLGLGDPPLSVTHPTIEYMFAPSSEYHRFGNYFKTNSYGMRADEFSQHRENNEVRIIVLGDSVPNGGNLTDQSELATELIKKNLKELISVPVIVGNVSAGTWSPPNLLAYVEEFGTFGADAAVIILNKGDMFDFPTFKKLNPNTHPTEKPLFALWELFSRYITPRLIKSFSSTVDVSLEVKENSVGNKRSCVPELLSLMEEFTQKSIPVFLVYHPADDEILPDGSFDPKGGYSEIKDFTNIENIRLYSLASSYGNYVEGGESPFRDNYHPNPTGQGLIAEYILGILRENGLTSRWSQRR